MTVTYAINIKDHGSQMHVQVERIITSDGEFARFHTVARFNAYSRNSAVRYARSIVRGERKAGRFNKGA